MRYRMERFVLLPFSVGCISESSVAIGHQHHHKSPSPEPNLTPTSHRFEPWKYPPTLASGRKEERKMELEEEQEEDDDKSLEGENLKNTLGLMALPKFQRIFKNFKNLSHLFVDKDEEDDEEMGMEIGLPTDVKHVTHIGIDGGSTSILSRSWDHPLQSPHHHDFFNNTASSPFAMAAPHSLNTSMATHFSS